jgi:hypothetical protein
MTKKEVYEILKKIAPENAAKIVVDYEGSGDEFGSFHTMTAFDANDHSIDHIFSQDVIWKNKIDDYIFDLFDKTSYVDFNNEGSAGTVTFDLDHFATIIENKSYFLADEENPDEYF